MDRAEERCRSSDNASFNGAAIIDAEGNEIPITESMIQQACQELDQPGVNVNDFRYAFEHYQMKKQPTCIPDIDKLDNIPRRLV